MIALAMIGGALLALMGGVITDRNSTAPLDPWRYLALALIGAAAGWMAGAAL